MADHDLKVCKSYIQNLPGVSKFQSLNEEW